MKEILYAEKKHIKAFSLIKALEEFSKYIKASETLL